MHKKQEIFRIRHCYDRGDRSIFIERASGNTDPIRAAVYCHFMAEEWFGMEVSVPNFCIAAMLIAFYGFSHTARVVDESETPFTDIEMFEERERRCAPEEYEPLMSDISLHRDALKDLLQLYI